MPKNYQPQDKFFKKAKELGYKARSAFKLEEIQSRLHIIKPGNHVLDLGAAPGSFMQLISKIVGVKGSVFGIDLKPISDIKMANAKGYQGDIFDEKIYAKILTENNLKTFDVITSDLAPSTTGIKSLDAGRSFQLNEQVLKIADKYLKKGGNVLLKAFPGADQNELLHSVKINYQQIKVFKPEAVRITSREVYIVGLGKIK